MARPLQHSGYCYFVCYILRLLKEQNKDQLVDVTVMVQTRPQTALSLALIPETNLRDLEIFTA